MSFLAFFQDLSHRIESWGPPVEKTAIRLDSHFVTIVGTLREIRDALDDRALQKDRQFTLNNSSAPLDIPSGEDWVVSVISTATGRTAGVEVSIALGGKTMFTTADITNRFAGASLVLKGGAEYTVSANGVAVVSLIAQVQTQSREKPRHAWAGDTEDTLARTLRGVEPERREAPEGGDFSKQVPSGIGLKEDASGLEGISSRHIPIRHEGQ